MVPSSRPCPSMRSSDRVTANRDMFTAHRAGQPPRALRGLPAGV